MVYSLPTVVLMFTGLLNNTLHPRTNHANIRDLEFDAVKEDNEVKYMFLQKIKTSKDKDEQIEFYCLCLLVVLVFGFFSEPNINSSLIYWVNKLMFEGVDVLSSKAIMLILWMLLFFCAYLGVYQGCLKSAIEKRKIYFPNYYNNEQDG